jgi:hypothetical protein
MSNNRFRNVLMNTTSRLSFMLVEAAGTWTIMRRSEFVEVVKDVNYTAAMIREREQSA